MGVSPAMQEYLAEIYRIAYYQPGDGYVSTSALAGAMGVTAAAVTRMVKRLHTAGYLEHEPYQGIRLTANGDQEALRSIRRHRLVERFLVDVMVFGWHEVHDEADDLGSAISDTLVDRMDEMAGFPRRCPHGEPIPSADGIMPQIADWPLNEATPEQAYVLSRVNTHDSEKLEYLERLGLLPGKTFELVSQAPFNGPLQLRINDEMQFIGYELAGALRVCHEGEFELA
jgi:DtxR family transcriptional regulator, Mn-dependent transcriptional regulator